MTEEPQSAVSETEGEGTIEAEPKERIQDVMTAAQDRPSPSPSTKSNEESPRA